MGWCAPAPSGTSLSAGWKGSWRSIEAELRQRLEYEVSSERLGEMVLERLQDVDPVAYVRFASVYRQFESLEEFTRSWSD